MSNSTRADSGAAEGARRATEAPPESGRRPPANAPAQPGLIARCKGLISDGLLGQFQFKF